MHFQSRGSQLWGDAACLMRQELGASFTGALDTLKRRREMESEGGDRRKGKAIRLCNLSNGQLQKHERMDPIRLVDNRIEITLDTDEEFYVNMEIECSAPGEGYECLRKFVNQLVPP